MGTSHEHLEYPGTLSFSADTLMSVVMDLGASVRRAGVRKVVLTNGHGGNVALLNVAARRLRVEHGLLAVCCHYPFLPLPEGLWPAEELRFGIHAGGVETSMMAHLQPSLVRCAANEFHSGLLLALAQVCVGHRCGGSMRGPSPHRRRAAPRNTSYSSRTAQL